MPSHCTMCFNAYLDLYSCFLQTLSNQSKVSDGALNSTSSNLWASVRKVVRKRQRLAAVWGPDRRCCITQCYQEACRPVTCELGGDVQLGGVRQIEEVLSDARLEHQHVHVSIRCPM
jgi:hypothetical protein